MLTNFVGAVALSCVLCGLAYLIGKNIALFAGFTGTDATALGAIAAACTLTFQIQYGGRRQ